MMAGLRLLVAGVELAAFGSAVRIDLKELNATESHPFCEVLSVSAVAGVYDEPRGYLLVPTAPTSRLSDLPEHVQALVCSCTSAGCTNTGVGAEPEYVVLLSPERGATLVLPREAATSASQVRVRPAPQVDRDATKDFVVLARGSDPYAALVDATKMMSHEAGQSEPQGRVYVLPLLDSVNRLRYDTALAAARATASSGILSSKAAPVSSLVSSLEQQLHEGILVQAGPNCPPKPLLQAPSLRPCQGMQAALGVCYSGMSVVYGTATGHVLAIMETTAALKMAPANGLRSSATGSSLTSRPSLHPYNSVGSESPSAMSAGVSAGTSASPSPSMSRANSCGGLPADIMDSSSISTSPSVSTSPSQPPFVKVMSGRSITAAPLIHVLAAATASSTARLQQSTPTGAPVQVLASFALLGTKPSAGREAVVRCCRIMPSSAVLASGTAEEDADCAIQTAKGLGLVVQVEMTATAATSLLMFVDGPEEELSLELGHGARDGLDAMVVRGVKIDGRSAKWRYDLTGGVLKVDLPAAATTGPRAVQVFL